jgi:hypothetical protein
MIKYGIAAMLGDVAGLQHHDVLGGPQITQP